MKTEPELEHLEIPASLSEQIGKFEIRLKKMETLFTIFGGLCGVLLTYGILFLSDRFWDTPGWLRVPLTFLGGVGLACFVYYWLNHWLWKRRDTRELAKLIQKHHKKLGDRLLGAVELAKGENLPDNISPELCKAAINQVSEESTKYNFGEAVESKRSYTFAMAFGFMAMLVLSVCLYAPEAAKNAFARFFNPFSDVSRYTFVSLEDMPAVMDVPHGEEFPVNVRLDSKSRWKPADAVCWIENQPKIPTKLEEGVARFTIHGQTHESYLNIKIGDVSRKIKIVPHYRPELEQLAAMVTLPDYLERPKEEMKISNARAQFLKGSKVAFAGQVNRPLAEAHMEPAEEMALKVEDKSFSTDTFEAEKLDEFEFSWKDKLDLAAAEPYKLKVTTVDDDPPFVECSGVARAIAILEDEIVDLEITAEDDFGAKELWVNWQSEGSEERGIKEVSGTKALQTGGPDIQLLESGFAFSPIAHHVPEETMITLAAYASDYLPGRKPAMSLLHKIYVLSRARHAELLRQNMEAIQARIEDIARDEEDLIAANEALAKNEELQKGEKGSEELKKSEGSERKNSEELNKLSESGQELLKEAMRNKDIPEETLAEWTKMVQSMEDVAQNDMQEAAKSLKEAQQAQGPQQKGKRSEKLKKAIEKEKEVLAKLREMEKDINKSIEFMMAKNFVNRLRAAAEVEGEIALSMSNQLPKTIGLSVDIFPPELRKGLEQMVAKQDATQKDVKYIHSDLSGFYNRTRIQIFNTIAEEMTNTKAEEKLGELSGLIARNVGMEVIKKARAWNNQLNNWADMLEESAKKDEQEKDPAEAGEGELDIEVLIALMRARQREESLREQTRLIEEQKDNNRNHTKDARKLSRIQYDIASDIRPLERSVPDPKLAALIKEVGGEMMNAGMFLNKPDTGESTVAIETYIIELLSGSISDCSKQCNSQMAGMLMKSMGMPKPGMGSGAGPMGGGSTAGGLSTEPNIDTSGDPNGDPGAERDVEKTGGVDRSNLPEEFKDIFGAYYNAIDQEDGATK